MVHFGTVQRTKTAISSSKASSTQASHVVVDHSGNWPDDWADTPVLRPMRNGGFAAGANLGARYALDRGATHIWLLNNDAEPARGALDELLRAASATPSPAIIGSLELDSRDEDPDGPWALQAPVLPKAVRGLVRSDDGTRRYDFLSGFSVLVGRDVFEQIGFLDESFFHYFEDVDFSIRAALGGVNVVLDRRSRVTHNRATSLGRDSSQATYYMFRNRLLLARRYRRGPALWILATADPRHGIRPLFSRRKARNREWAWLRGAWLGTLDGLRGRTGARKIR